MWLFREKITDTGIVEKLFNLFHNYLLENNLIVYEWQGDEIWNDKPGKKETIDIDARWTKKAMKIFMAILHTREWNNLCAT